MTRNNNQQIVKFRYLNENLTEKEKPVPSRSVTPDWYEALSAKTGDKTILDSTAKMCMPFNDALQMGWMLKMPSTVTFNTSENNSFKIDDGKDDDINIESVDVSGFDVDGNSQFKLPDFIIHTNWNIETPKGYSTLFVNPMNRDIPDRTSFGQFIPTDSYSGKIEIPIHIHEDTVTIEKGDPISQIIPLKRDDLLDSMSTESFSDYQEVKSAFEIFSSVINDNPGYYRESARIKKPTTTIVENKKPTDELKEYSDPMDKENSLIGEYNIDEQKFISDEGIYENMQPPVKSHEVIPEGYETKLKNSEIKDKWVLNAMKLGSVVKTCADVMVDTKRNKKSLDSSGFDGIGIKSMGDKQIGKDNPLVPFSSVVNMINKWVVVVPKGYCTLELTPINHFQEIYRSYCGLVDSDVYLTTANAPGMIIGERREVIPRGSNVAQFIPIKRDSLLSSAEIINN